MLFKINLYFINKINNIIVLFNLKYNKMDKFYEKLMIEIIEK